MNRPRKTNALIKSQSQIQEFFTVSKIEVNKEQEKPKIKIQSQQVIKSQSTPPSLIQSVTCPICSMILPIPHYECGSCNNLFCNECLHDWWSKNPKQCIFKCDKPIFKVIKRSNTYNAVLDIIRIKCRQCGQISTVSDYQIHLDKYCPEMQQKCSNDGCQDLIKRKDIQNHAKQCKFRFENCQFCNLKFKSIEMTIHQQQQCLQRKVLCQNKQCAQNIVYFKYKSHKQICPYNLVLCEWCKKEFFDKDQKQHQSSCELKLIQCHWCQKQFFLLQMIKHDCPEKAQVCPLCQDKVKSKIMEQHKLKCMFQNLVLIKHQNRALIQQNQKLTRKISILQQAIQDSSQKNQSHTIKMLKNIKEKQKKQIKKDLDRVQYSIRSVEKLKKEELQSHMLFPHLIQSWCPVCKDLDKKFKQMLDPLIQKKKQFISKISQIERFQQTARGQ